ncbi:MAG: LysR family transcriptional regulator [Rhodomicrobium sp.]|nr:LysR family transcriptional regulator [Rhodomicrobium sp.]
MTVRHEFCGNPANGLDRRTDCFCRGCARGSFVGAARALGVTPSGVSRKISRYVDRLGDRLFNRTTCALSLTEAGEILYEKCADILSSVEDVESAIGNFRNAAVGALRVAASDALAVEVLMPFIKLFRERTNICRSHWCRATAQSICSTNASMSR